MRIAQRLSGKTFLYIQGKGEIWPYAFYIVSYIFKSVCSYTSNRVIYVVPVFLSKYFIARFIISSIKKGV